MYQNMLRQVYQNDPNLMVAECIKIYGNILEYIIIWQNIFKRSNPKVVEWDPVAEEWTVRITVLPKLPSSSSPSSSSLSLSKSLPSPSSSSLSLLESISLSYNHFLDRWPGCPVHDVCKRQSRSGRSSLWVDLKLLSCNLIKRKEI